MEPRVYLIAGLGNPGRKYEGTRHNAGFMVIDILASTFSIPVQKLKYDVLFGRGRIEGCEVLLAKPQAYMNRSGPALRALADYFKIRKEAMIIVHDDVDLAYERLKIKEKGGDGGHKGIRSIINTFGGDEFLRVRVGVGRPDGGSDVVDHVLKEFTSDENMVLERFLQRTCEAVVTVLTKGTQEGMNRFNEYPR